MGGRNPGIDQQWAGNPANLGQRISLFIPLSSRFGSAKGGGRRGDFIQCRQVHLMHPHVSFTPTFVLCASNFIPRASFFVLQRLNCGPRQPVTSGKKKKRQKARFPQGCGCCTSWSVHKGLGEQISAVDRRCSQAGPAEKWRTSGLPCHLLSQIPTNTMPQNTNMRTSFNASFTPTCRHHI